VLPVTNFLKPVNVFCGRVSWDIKNYFKGHIHGKKGLETFLEILKVPSYSLLLYTARGQGNDMRAMTSLFVQQMNCDTQ